MESDDRSPASVRGVLELLTSAYSVLPALAEARILEFNTQVRPALPYNLGSLHIDRESTEFRYSLSIRLIFASARHVQ
jgi:glycine oxidase